MAKIWIKNLQKRIKLNPKKIKKIAVNIFSQEAPEKAVELTICFVTDKKIRKLNARYHKTDCFTDVLAFVLNNNAKNIAGDIFISTDTVIYNSRFFKTRPIKELNLYIIHGILHILGFNDLMPKDRKIMRKKEKFYLSHFNL